MSGNVFGYINLCIMKCLIGRNVTILRNNCLLDLLRLVAADSFEEEGGWVVEDDDVVENNNELEEEDQ